MIVDIIAHTVFHPGKNFQFVDQHDATHADTLAEAAGRLCYMSFQRPNPATATNKGYLANILGQGHESVLEHSSVSFYVDGVSRALLTELSRHRHLSFSVVSQRYVDASSLGNIYPPALNHLPMEVSMDVQDALVDCFNMAREGYEAVCELLTDAGLPRKQAREAARAVLPNGTNSPMIVTGNLRAWRDVLKKRYHVAADAEIRQFAERVLDNLHTLAPNSVQDFPNEPFGDNA